MTESVINSQDIRQYWSTQDRVNHWVEEHNGVDFSSPNIPPSELDGEEGAYAISEVESSHSLPPRLMLRYPDGTEIPIPHPTGSNSPQNISIQPSRSGKHSSSGAHSSHHSRTGSVPSRHSSKHQPSPLSDRHERERERLRSRSPEEIRILPSNHTPEAIRNEGSRAASHTSHPSHHTRSRSLPRDAFQEEPIHDPMPFSNSPTHSPTSPNGGAVYPTHRASPIKLPRTPPPDPKMHLARSQPPAWHPYTNGSRMTAVPMNPHRHVHNPKHMPPSIVYAPSNHSRNQYNPPPIYSYPPNFGPDGLMYSHSVPPTKMYRHAGGTPYPSAGGSVGYHPPPPPPPAQAYPHRSRERSEERGRASADERRHVDVSRGTNGSSKSKKSSKSRKSGHDRSKSLPLQEAFGPPVTPVDTPPRSHSPSGSDVSGSTYYVLPSRRQKVHVLRPQDTPGSIRTATSSTKSPTTPISPAGSMKKPFFARLRGLAGRLSSNGGSEKSLERRERRHSTGNSNSSRGRES